MPKSFMNKVGQLKKADDLHNIYPCCAKLNKKKGSMIFGKDFLFEIDTSYHSGALARACLYMYDKYDLPIDIKTVSIWRKLDEICVPQRFEITRNEIIYKTTGIDNHYLINHFVEDND
jgi:endonuclease I